MIYFLYASEHNLLKVGYTRSSKYLNRRTTAGRVLCGESVELLFSIPGSAKGEKFIHKLLSDSLIFRNEWFYVDESVMRVVERIAIGSDQLEGYEKFLTLIGNREIEVEPEIATRKTKNNTDSPCGMINQHWG